MTAAPIINIRPVQQRDLAAVAAIDDQAFSPYGTAEDPDIIAARFSVFPEGFLVAESAGQLLGYVSSEQWRHEREPSMNEDPAASHDPAGTILCITAMAVRTDHWNQGIGSRLLEDVIGLARKRGCSRIVLETTHARDFYLHRGFRLTGERQQMNAELYIMEFSIEPRGDAL